MLAEMICTIAFATANPPVEGPFQELTFDQALAAAKKDGKVVMIDFFTTWCQPCKKLDKVTWADAGVQKWLAEKTVPLKIDAEKEVELAKRFGVEAYPTIVFVKADGTKVDAVVGFKESKEFLELANAILDGKPVVTVAKEKVAGHERDPMAREHYGQELVRAGKYAEALEEYLWCFDQGAVADDSYSAVRRSFLLSNIAQLGSKYPPALKALEDRRTSAQELLLSGKGTWDQIADVSALDRCLGTPKKLLEIFDKMKEKKLLTEGLRFGFRQHVGEALVEAGRYDDFLEGIADPVKDAESAISTAKTSLKMLESMQQREGTDGPVTAMRERHVSEISGLYEALLGTKQEEKAAIVAKDLLEFAPSGQTYSTLIGRAAHAEHMEVARALLERGRKELPDDEKKALELAAKRIPSK